MTTTGSLINNIMARSTKGEPDPAIGMGATILMYSDRHAATIFSIEKEGSKTVIGVRRDASKVIKGSTFDGSAEYEHTPNSAGPLSHYRKNPQTGRWDAVRFNRETGRFNKIGDGGLMIGRREEYYDPHF